MAAPLHSLSGPIPHLVLEGIAYFVAARVYWAFASTQAQPPRILDRWLLAACAIAGAAVGSKGLHVLEHLPALWHQGRIADWLGGKSVLGGFIGGTLAVEAGKRSIGWQRSTGDAWVPALALGLMIGRVGCQLSGLWDETCGTPTALPWGWDYGDGVPRHPAALYEIVLVGLAWLGVSRWRDAPPGARFATFLAAYCTIRFALEFLKPPFGPLTGAELAATLPVARYDGLTAIQWTALAGLAGYLALLRHRLHPPVPALR
jgi:phosphatidylglycerol---prolipoprotein diacylglyceryl transferase